MAANGARRYKSGDRSGQSLIELVLILPAFVGMLYLMVRVSSAIQVSIVNQKYSRQRLLEIAGNSPHYPSVGRAQAVLIPQGDNRLTVGVSEESTQSISGGFQPSAPTQLIVRSTRRAEGASDRAGEEPARRANVRIRNTVELCTPILATSTGGAQRRPLAIALSESTLRQVSFCSGGIDE